MDIDNNPMDISTDNNINKELYKGGGEEFNVSTQPKMVYYGKKTGNSPMQSRKSSMDYIGSVNESDTQIQSGNNNMNINTADITYTNNANVEQEHFRQRLAESWISWVNSIIANTGSNTVKNLNTDFTDGLVLIKLIEAGFDVNLGTFDPNPTREQDKISNIELCLNFLKNELRLSDLPVSASDIAIPVFNANRHAACVELLLYSILQGLMIRVMNRADHSEYYAKSCNIKESLLNFVNIIVNRNFPDKPWIKNFGVDFSDGIALCCIMELLCSGKINLATISTSSSAPNITLALKIAERELHIISPFYYRAPFLSQDIKSEYSSTQIDPELMQTFIMMCLTSANIRQKQENNNNNNNTDKTTAQIQEDYEFVHTQLHSELQEKNAEIYNSLKHDILDKREVSALSNLGKELEQKATTFEKPNNELMQIESSEQEPNLRVELNDDVSSVIEKVLVERALLLECHAQQIKKLETKLAKRDAQVKQLKRTIEAMKSTENNVYNNNNSHTDYEHERPEFLRQQELPYPHSNNTSITANIDHNSLLSSLNALPDRSGFLTKKSLTTPTRWIETYFILHADSLYFNEKSQQVKIPLSNYYLIKNKSHTSPDKNKVLAEAHYPVNYSPTSSKRRLQVIQNSNSSLDPSLRKFTFIHQSSLTYENGAVVLRLVPKDHNISQLIELTGIDEYSVSNPDLLQQWTQDINLRIMLLQLIEQSGELNLNAKRVKRSKSISHSNEFINNNNDNVNRFNDEKLIKPTMLRRFSAPELGGRSRLVRLPDSDPLVEELNIAAVIDAKLKEFQEKENKEKLTDDAAKATVNMEHSSEEDNNPPPFIRPLSITRYDSETDEMELIDPTKSSTSSSTVSSSPLKSVKPRFSDHFSNNNSNTTRPHFLSHADRTNYSSSDEEDLSDGEHLLAPKDPRQKLQLSSKGKTVMPSLNQVKSNIMKMPEIQRRNSASLRNLLQFTENELKKETPPRNKFNRALTK